MFDSFREFFQEEVSPDTAAGADEHRLQLATCALLLEIAWADDAFSEDERKTVAAVVRRRFGLGDAAAATLIELARQERKRSTDLYQFTRLIREKLPRPERLQILESLWTVVYSDGVFDAHEDALVYKLTRLLGLKHQEAIALKLHARDAADPR